MTTLNEAGESIVARFDTALGATVEYTLSNDDFEPSTIDTTWVRLTYKEVIGKIDSYGSEGSRKYKRIGIIFAQIFTPLNIGSGAAEALGHTVRALFEGVKFGGVWGLDGTIRTVGRDGDWYQVNVAVNFEYFETK